MPNFISYNNPNFRTQDVLKRLKGAFWNLNFWLLFYFIVSCYASTSLGPAPVLSASVYWKRSFEAYYLTLGINVCWFRSRFCLFLKTPNLLNYSVDLLLLFLITTICFLIQIGVELIFKSTIPFIYARYCFNLEFCFFCNIYLLSGLLEKNTINGIFKFIVLMMLMP
jgi:hypothetical protein